MQRRRLLDWKMINNAVYTILGQILLLNQDDSSLKNNSKSDYEDKLQNTSKSKTEDVIKKVNAFDDQSNRNLFSFFEMQVL